MNPNSQSTPTAANVGQPSQMVESRGVEPLPVQQGGRGRRGPKSAPGSARFIART
jgi:hypothetical protein